MSTEVHATATSQLRDATGRLNFPEGDLSPKGTYGSVRHGLGRTLLKWFLLLPVMSLVIAGIIISTIAIRDARQAAIERLSAIATLKQSEINVWVASQQEELDLIVNTPDIQSNMLSVLSGQAEDPPRPPARWREPGRAGTETGPGLSIAARDQLQEYVSIFTSRSSAFEELFLLNISGRAVLSSDPSQVGASHGQQAYFVKGKEAPYAHPPYYSLFTAAPSMIVAQPVEDSQGRVRGVLAGRLSLDQMANVTKEQAGLGETGETYLVNAGGLLLTPPRFGKELAPGQEIHTEGVERGLALGSAASQEQAGRPASLWDWSVYTNYRGRPVLGVYRWFPDLQIVLLAEQEVSETVALTRNILAISLVILLIMAGVAVIIALLVSGRITSPLVGLTTIANLMASGDLSHEVPYTGRRDEIGTLARAFNLMSQQLRDLITNLEEQVTRRTRQWQDANYKLQRRAIQLEAVTLVGRAATSILNLDELLLEVVNLIRARFNFYHAGIFFIDESGEWAVLRQATGEAGQRMLARKHQLAVGSQSIVGWVTAHRQPRIALDVGEDTVHFKNPDLPHTRSEMALPMLIGNRLLGALDVQSTEEAAFDQEDIAILSLMADQIAVAIDNALKFSHEATILESTSPLYRASRQIALATNLEDVLRSIVDHATGPYVDYCAINLYLPGSNEKELGWFEVAALWDRADPTRDPCHLRGIRYPVVASSLMDYLRRETAEPLVVNDLLTRGIDERLDSSTQRSLAEEQQIRAILMLPLVAAGRVGGLLVVASRQPHAWTETELRTFRSLSDQTAIAVENVRLLGETQARAGRERIIRQITEQMWRAVDVETILQTTVNRLGQAMEAPRVYVRLATETELERSPRRGPGNGDGSTSLGDRLASLGDGSSPAEKLTQSGDTA